MHGNGPSIEQRKGPQVTDINDYKKTAAQLVKDIAVALYGDRWIADLARDLDINRRTVERVAQAVNEGRDYPAARAWLEDLSQLAFRRKEALGAHLDRLSAVVNMPFRLTYRGDKGSTMETMHPTYAEAALHAAELFTSGAAIKEGAGQRTIAVEIERNAPRALPAG